MEKKNKILIVDDDVDIVEALKIVLESNNYEVVTASDGVEGLEKVKLEKPDVIILDLMMPKEDGDEVCRTLKNDPEYLHIPILILTAISEKMHMKYKLDDVWLPAEYYIEKPIKPAELLKRLERILKNKK